MQILGHKNDEEKDFKVTDIVDVRDQCWNLFPIPGDSSVQLYISNIDTFKKSLTFFPPSKIIYREVDKKHSSLP